MSRGLPERDQDISYMIHPAIMNVSQFFICGGHEKQPRLPVRSVSVDVLVPYPDETSS